MNLFRALTPFSSLARSRQIARVLRHLAAVGLFAVGTTHLAAQPTATAWSFNGYFFADGEEWFSLQNPSGEREWFRKGGRAGTIQVEHFDAERGVLAVIVNGRPHALALGRAQIAVNDEVMPTTHAEAQAPLATPEKLAPMTPAERFEKLKVQALARRIEREEVLLEQPSAFRSVAGTSDLTLVATVASTAERATSPAVISELSGIGPLSTEDWLAIHRRTAQRRGVLEEKWAAEKLAWASGQSPARTPVR